MYTYLIVGAIASLPTDTINQSQRLSAGNLRKDEERGQRARNRTISQETNRSKETYNIIILAP
jgi:hypothetical protein